MLALCGCSDGSEVVVESAVTTATTTTSTTTSSTTTTSECSSHTECANSPRLLFATYCNSVGKCVECEDCKSVVNNAIDSRCPKVCWPNISPMPQFNEQHVVLLAEM